MRKQGSLNWAEQRPGRMKISLWILRILLAGIRMGEVFSFIHVLLSINKRKDDSEWSTKPGGHSWESHGELFSDLETQSQNSQFFFLVILEFRRTGDPHVSKLSTFEQECAQWLSYACLTTAFWMCVDRKLFSLVLHVSHLHLKSCAQGYICTWPWFR